MFHPLQLVPHRKRASVMWPTALIAAGLAIVLTWQGMPLRTRTAPQGIVSLELAGNARRTSAILAEWRDDHPGISLEDRMDTLVQAVPKGKDELAQKLTMLDFVFLLAYPAALSMACVWLARRTPWPAAGVTLGWLIWPAALLDAIENTLVIRAFNGLVDDSAAAATCGLALGKFALFLGALGFACYGLWTIGRRVLAAILGLVWLGTAYSVAAALLG